MSGLPKTVVVTGSNGEIGRGICRHLSEKGARVLAVTRRPTSFADSSGEIQNIVVPDLIDEKRVTQIFEEARRAGSVIDGLVVGAAIFKRIESLDAMTLAEWRETLDVNVVSAFLWNRSFGLACERSDTEGSAINITSQAAFTGGFGGVIPYAASKGAMISMVRGLARHFANKKIRFNCVAPGFIETSAMTSGLNEEKLELFHSRVPMKRFGEVQEVVNVVDFLLSSSSDYITGTTIDVTGGLLMR
jgi:3-oxoacyl-[acyl-carrier protein] reductase